MRDMDIREALHRELKIEHAEEPDTLILDELGLCQGTSRVDIAVVNGAITGYEIKSPKDTLDRLPVQQEVYSKTLDRVIIVAGESHVEHAMEIIPSWWGINIPYIEDETIQFRTIRDPQKNPSKDPYSLVQLLWKEEALEELARLGMDRGVKSKPRAFVWERLSNALTIDDLSQVVRDRLKARKAWRVDERYV